MRNNEKQMMIDYRDEAGKIIRTTIEDNQFSVREGLMIFWSPENDTVQIPLEDVIQVYMT